MDWWKIIVGVIAFAIVTAILYIWGLRKQIDQTKDLNNLLMAKGIKIVKDYLKCHDFIRISDISGSMFGLTAKRFYSRNKIVVKDGDQFAKDVFKYMTKTGQLIEESGRYRLK